MDKRPDSMTIEELRTELQQLKDNLCDFEDMHYFTFQKTSVHIGAEMAQNMQTEFEEECRKYGEQIEEVQKELKARDPLQHQNNNINEKKGGERWPA